MNKIIGYLILSDIALVGGFGFIAPIFAIFVSDKIEGGSIEVVGYAAAVYLIVKSLAVIPIGRYLDKNHGERDDFWFLVIGNFVAASVVFGYIFSTQPWQIYFLQVFYGIGTAMNVPAYTAVFTRHIDRGREASDWSVRSALIGIAAGLAGALGGIIAANFGFKTLFFGVGVLVFLGGIFPFFIKREFFPSNRKVSRIAEEKTGNLPEINK